MHHTDVGPGDFPFRPRARTPVFYGSLDWHSCVEMHWLLVRLLRIAGDAVPASAIRKALRAQFSPVALAVEADYIAGPGRWRERPYGWGWALALIHEAWLWDDPEGPKWAAAMAPLADAITGCFLDWLPKATYPVRCGVHANSAFGLSRAPWLRAAAGGGLGDPALLEAIARKSLDWYGADMLYPGGWEPSGHDFLSPALAEAELMAQILPQGSSPGGCRSSCPGSSARARHAVHPGGRLGRQRRPDRPPARAQREPGLVLAANRGVSFRPGTRVSSSAEARRAGHADAALPHVIGDDYMVEHWLACYAVLLLS